MSETTEQVEALISAREAPRFSRRRVLFPSEQRLAPARRCPVCGNDFQPNMKAVWSGKGKTCSPKCRSLFASRKSVQGFTPGLNTHLKDDAQYRLLRAVNAGEIVRPATCSQCPATDVEAHHPDYAKPLDVKWLCPLCHRAKHYLRNAEKGGRQPDLKRAFKRIRTAIGGAK